MAGVSCCVTGNAEAARGGELPKSGVLAGVDIKHVKEDELYDIDKFGRLQILHCSTTQGKIMNVVRRAV